MCAGISRRGWSSRWSGQPDERRRLRRGIARPRSELPLRVHADARRLGVRVLRGRLDRARRGADPPAGGHGRAGGDARTWAGNLAGRWIARATGTGRPEPPATVVPPAAGRWQECRRSVVEGSPGRRPLPACRSNDRRAARRTAPTKPPTRKSWPRRAEVRAGLLRAAAAGSTPPIAGSRVRRRSR